MTAHLASPPLEDLHALDPAPPTTLTASQAARRDALFLRVTSAEVTKRSHAKSRRIVLGGLGLSALTVGAFVIGLVVTTGAVTPQPAVSNFALPARGELASWTSTPTPTPPSPALADACTQASATHPATSKDIRVFTSEVRGAFTAQMMQVGDETGYCISTPSAGASWILIPADNIVDASPVTAAQVSEAWVQDASLPDDLGNAVLVGGSAGEDVIGVRVHRKDGTFVIATVNNGHWSAWWPSGESPEGDVRSESGVFGDELDFTTTDGATHVMTTW
ncbi:hypothetical protein [Subtercola endophyticus]|uniref:hypothetical protein n=1 Tax=Subtercola endophyticus TaxID=2895559 RepID=UPI001E2A22EC|nr:hypothetical protein [Subtercola endophyticus]UFS60357.1 hypothetical protein LQ955_06300 [Subtercola endophyticus]